VLLALIGIFEPATLAVSWVVGCAAALIVALRRGAIGTISKGWLEHIRSDPWATAGAAATVIGVAIARSMIAPVTALAPTVLRNWADALEIADAGRIPEGTLQWGTVLPPITSKVVLNAFNAGASMLLGREVVVPQAALLSVVTIGLVVIVIALLTEMGLRRLAPIGALLLLVNHLAAFDLSTDLGRNLAENWGRLAAFSAVLCGVLAMRLAPTADGSENRPRIPDRTPLVVVGAILLGISAGTHLVTASVGVATICAITLASMVLTGWTRSTVLATGAILGGALTIGGAILALAPGDLGFTGAVGPDPYRRLEAELDLPPDFDPTRFITTHDVATAQRGRPADIGDVAEAFAYKVGGYDLVRVGPGEAWSSWALALPTVVALVLVLVVLLVGPSALRIVVLSAVILAVTLFVVGVVFALRYDEFVLEWFGNRRLFGYAVIPYVLVLIAAGEAALLRVSASPARAIAPIIAIAVVVTSTVVFAEGVVDREDSDQPWTSQLALVEWVGRHVPCEGRVLADRRTLGTFQAIAGRAGVMEGMGPHIRPAVLELAIAEIFRGRAFFEQPADGLAYLRERSVAAIVVTRPSRRFGILGYPIARVPPHRLDRVPFLRSGFRNAAGSVYLVEGTRPVASLPRVAGRPGFRCHGS
ncbi:MAG: hypothetical protein H0T07_05455, partial [Actinobacteria bacterium]|nr:hypothetical protein [Actinomycetota bacterium]